MSRLDSGSPGVGSGPGQAAAPAAPPTLAQRWAALPRSAKWLAACGVVVVGYFGVFEPLLNWRQTIDARAAAIQAQLDGRAKAATDAGAANNVELSVQSFGQPAMPAPVAERSVALDQKISSILRRHQDKVANLRRATLTDRGQFDAPPRALANAAATPGGGGELVRLEREITFEADVATTVAIVRELESTPEVAAVTRVTLNKQSRQGNPTEAAPLRVSLIVESWAIAGAQRAATQGPNEASFAASPAVREEPARSAAPNPNRGSRRARS